MKLYLMPKNSYVKITGDTIHLAAWTEVEPSNEKEFNYQA